MESMETVVEQKREAPKSVLDADDYREMGTVCSGANRYSFEL